MTAISIILCTHQRASSLVQTLESFCRLEVPAGLSWELIVVDNNSTDDTRAVCDRFADRLPLLYLLETRQGLSIARNRALADARGEWLLFTDDDVDVDQHWLATLHAATLRHPEIDFIGGVVLPRWEVPPPAWLVRHAQSKLPGVTMHFHIGDQERKLDSSDTLLFVGANMGFHRRVFIDGLRFDESLGRTGLRLLVGEESKVIRQIIARGGEGLYVPAAIVHHRNPRDRMTEKYVRDWFCGYGISLVRAQQIEPTCFWAGMPLRSIRRIVINAIRYGLTRWTCPSHIWLRAEIVFATHWASSPSFASGGNWLLVHLEAAGAMPPFKHLRRRSFQ